MAEQVSRFRGRDTGLSNIFPFPNILIVLVGTVVKGALVSMIFSECGLNSSLDFDL